MTTSVDMDRGKMIIIQIRVTKQINVNRWDLYI